MSRFFYESETGAVIDVDSLRTLYETTDDELITDTDTTFDEYIERCMSYNNGTLHTIHEMYEDSKRKLDNLLRMAQKYGYEEYADELAEQLADMHAWSKLL